ncbi:MAG: CHASE domain-containing protein [Sphingomonadales bacterium]|nr:CHASE domain-containing protein [Sphingomonadales bacterium]
MERRLEKRVRNQAWFLRYPGGLPFALFGFGLLVTVLAALNIEQSDSRTRRLELDRDATALAGELQRKATENIAYLNAAASLLSVSEHVSPQQFGRFVGDLSANHLSRGALAMGWIRWIKGRDVPGFENELRFISDQPGVSVQPAPKSPDSSLAVVELLEPRSPINLRALGFDMYSEPARKDAIDRAIRSGRPAVSGKVQLIQDADLAASPSVLIFIPVFRRDSEGERINSAPKGFAYTPLRVQDFLETVGTGFHHGQASAALYDGPAGPAHLLAQLAYPNTGGNRIERSFTFGDRVWKLVVTSNDAPGLTLTSVIVLVGGSVVSLLLLALIMVVIGRAADDRRTLEMFAAQESIRTSLTRELNHRVKNTLANVLSIVALTRRRAVDLDDFAEGLTGRVRALSATHDLLSQRDWRDAPVRDVVMSELAPYLDPSDNHVVIAGPDAVLAPRDALSLGLALHELATNAAKYGAFSVPEGRVEVRWNLLNPGLCELDWRESGGPPVTAPARRGFGLDLIEKIVSHELQSPIDLRFDRSGVTCVVRVPVRSATAFSLRGQTTD